MKKLMLIVMMCMITMVPFAKAGHHRHGYHNDGLALAAGIVGLVKAAITPAPQIVMTQPTFAAPVVPAPVVVPAPTVVQQYPAPTVVQTPQVVVAPAPAPVVVVPGGKPWGPRRGFTHHAPPPPRHHHGGHGRGHGGHRGGRR